MIATAAEGAAGVPEEPAPTALTLPRKPRKMAAAQRERGAIDSLPPFRSPTCFRSW
jgi:hypothetical protein